MNKRVNYMELLKESVADRGHDTRQSVDVKGPFLDPILGYDGGGELPTHKDASSILERYYFNQDSDRGVRVSEDAKIPQVGDDKGALPDAPPEGGVKKSKELAKKATELKEEDNILEEDDVENAVIERLIAEMEEDSNLLDEGEEPPQDPAAKFHDPEGKPSKDASKDITGDEHKGGEGAVKEAKEMLDDTEDTVPGGNEEPTEDLDIDKKTDIKNESGSPIGNPSDAEDFESLDEEFQIFKEAIKDDDEVNGKDEDKDEDDVDKKGKVPAFDKKNVKV